MAEMNLIKGNYLLRESPPVESENYILLWKVYCKYFVMRVSDSKTRCCLVVVVDWICFGTTSQKLPFIYFLILILKNSANIWNIFKIHKVVFFVPHNCKYLITFKLVQLKYFNYKQIKIMAKNSARRLWQTQYKSGLEIYFWNW